MKAGQMGACHFCGVEKAMMAEIAEFADPNIHDSLTQLVLRYQRAVVGEKEMNELITLSAIEVNGKKIQTINARELHAFLESKQEFRHWIKNRIDQYGFVENQDFITSENFIRGGVAIDYHISIDMGKELSMVERNEKGKEARQYFIDCESRAKTPAIDLNDPGFLRKTLLSYTERVIALEEKVDELVPKAIAMDRFSEHEGKHGMRNAAKVLGIQESKLKTWMLIKSWYYRGHSRRLCAYADKITAGYLDTIPVEIRRSEGTEVVPQPVITQKGLAKLAELLAKDGLIKKVAA